MCYFTYVQTTCSVDTLKSQIVFYYKFDPFPPSQEIDPDFKFMENNLRVRYREESAGSKFFLKSYLYLGLFFILL